MQRILTLSLISLFTFFVGCDIENSVSNARNDKSDIGSTSVDIKEDPESDEYQIRKSFIEHTQDNLKLIKDIDDYRKALLNFEHRNAAKYLKFKIPENYDPEKYSELRSMLKAFSGMIATDYCVSKKIVFDSKMIALLDKTNRNAFDWNVFDASGLSETAQLIAYWHFKNYRVSDEVFYSSHNDYSPFTEDELSLLIWSKILQDWTGNKYKSEITKEMISMGILTLEEGKLRRTVEWNDKIREDTENLIYNMTRSKIKYKYDLGFNPDSFTDGITSKLNNEYPEKGFNSSLGLGGNIGGGGGPGGGTGCGDTNKHYKQTMLRSEVLSKFEKEDLLSLFDIQSLLASKEFKQKFQGTIHLFRYIEINNDYSKIADILPAFETDENQLNSYIYNKIERLAKKASQTKDRNHIKDFLYSLFDNQTKNRSKYIFLALRSDEESFTSRFIELLLTDKIIEVENQEILISYIINKKLDKYIQRLFAWRFNKDNDKKDKIAFIPVDDFCVKLVLYKRDLFLTNTIRVLKKLSSKEYNDVRELNKYFFKQMTNMEIINSGYLIKVYEIDPKVIEKNHLYLEEIHLFKDNALKHHLYNAIARNCKVVFDETLYKWLENENDIDLLRSMSLSFCWNIFRIKSEGIVGKVIFDLNDSDKTPTIVRNNIRMDEIRFEKFARIAISRKILDLDNYVFPFLYYMKASRAWPLIKQVLDNNYDWYFKIYSEELDELKPDELGLIEVYKLRSKLVKYMIDGLTLKTEPKLHVFLSALSILSK